MYSGSIDRPESGRLTPIRSSNFKPRRPASPHDYSRGVLKVMNSPFFPDMRRNLGPYLVDKTGLIKNIVDNNGQVMFILFFDPDVAGNPPCCNVSLYPLSVLNF